MVVVMVVLRVIMLVLVMMMIVAMMRVVMVVVVVFVRMSRRLNLDLFIMVDTLLMLVVVMMVLFVNARFEVCKLGLSRPVVVVFVIMMLVAVGMCVRALTAVVVAMRPEHTGDFVQNAV